MTSLNAPTPRALAATLLTLGLVGAAFAPETRAALDEQSRAWREATEELRLYDRLETRLILRATLHTDEYVRAQDALLGLLQSTSPWEPRGDSPEWQVVFAAYVPPPSRADDFDFEPGATWTFQLLADGQPLGPDLPRFVPGAQRASGPALPAAQPLEPRLRRPLRPVRSALDAHDGRERGARPR
jgi:hypothetical protein